MSMRKFTKLLMLFTLCLVGIQGNAQNVTIRGNNGSMIASVPNSGTEYDTFFKVGGFATWQHEQLSMVLTASDFTTLTSFGQLSNPANNLFSDGTHLQIGKGQGDYNKCYLSLSLPKGYRFTGYTIVFSKPGQTTKRLGSNTASFNTSNATSRFGETNSSFAFTNYKDVAINGSQTITRTSNSDTDMGNVLYFSLQNPDSRALITLESAEFYFTAEANYTPLTAVGSVNRMSAVDIPFKTSKVDYGPIQKNTYNGAERLSYRSSNVKDLQANLTLYEAGSTKPGTDFDGTTGQVIDYKVGSISVEDGYYRIGAADASKPGTEEHIYYIETPSSVLLSDNATKNPIGYRIVGAKIDYKYGQTNVYGTKTKTYPTFYFMFHVLLLGDYYLNANGGTTQTSGDRAEWFQDDEGYIRTGVNGYIYLTDKGSIMGGSRYPSTTTNKADAVKFNTIGNDGVVSYTENGNTYYNTNVSHTLTVFYMERGMLDSNLLIRFNYSPEANFSKMKITEVTDFDNINEGLKNATMKAAEDDVFMYTVTNTNTKSEDVKTNSARFPVAAQSIRTNQSVTTQLTPGTGSPGTASIDFVPGAQDVPTAVANTSYLWVDEFADNSKIVGKSNGSGQLYLMYGTCKNLYPSAEETKVGKESSAEFEKQFTRNSTMAVLQSDTLYKPNRASSPGLFGDSNSVTGNRLSSVPTATRSVSAYYETTKIVKDRDKNTIPFINEIAVSKF